MKPPHITAWSGEVGYEIRPDPLIGEHPAVFAARGQQGDGAPVWGRISEERQRRAVVLRRCQVCDQHLSAPGLAFILTHETTLDGLLLTEPLVCRACAPAAMQCPRVREAIADEGLIVIEVASYRIGMQILRLGDGEPSDANRELDAALLRAVRRSAVGLCILANPKGRRVDPARLVRP